MKKICYVTICIALILAITGNNNLLADKKRKARKKKIKHEISTVLSETSMLSSPSSLENGIMTDLFKQAQDKAKQLEDEVSLRTKQLNERAEEQYRIMQEQIAQQTQEIQEQAKKQSALLAKKFKEQAKQVQFEVEQTSTALRKQATQQVISLFNQAEEEAIRRKREAEEEALRQKREAEEEILRQRREEREQFLRRQLEQSLEKKPFATSSLLETSSLAPLGVSLTRVDASWKEKTSEEFHNNMALMKKIILEGETESEAQDFMKRFSRQSRWFDTALSNTTYVCDEHYKELVKRSTRLHNVAQAQKIADQFLQTTVKERDLTNDEVKKIRLAILYEINTQINRPTSNGRRITLNDNELKFIVEQAIKETLPDAESKPPQLITIHRTVTPKQDTTTAIPLAISSSMNQDLETLAQEIKELKNALDREVKKRKKTKKKVKEKDAKIIELEERLAQAQISITHYKEQVSSTGQKFALKVEQTEQSKAAKQEQTTTLNKLQQELDQAKRDVEEITGKASAQLSTMKQEMESLSSTEEELRKKFAQSLEQEKKSNLELEQKNREVLEENKALNKKLSQVKDKTLAQANQNFKGKLEDVTKQLMTKEIDAQQATNKVSKLQTKIQDSEKKILQLTQDKVQLLQDKEAAVKQAENRLRNQFKGKVQETQAENINLQLEQRKASQTIAKLKDKVHKSEDEKNQAIQETSKSLQESFKETLSRKEQEALALQQSLQTQKEKAQKDLQDFETKARLDQNIAVKKAKDQTTEHFKPIMQEKEKKNLELEITARKALEETNKAKSDLISAYKEKDMAVKQTEARLHQSFKPRLEQAHKSQLESELQANVMTNKAKALEEKVQNLETKAQNLETKNGKAKSLLEQSNKQALAHEIEKNRLDSHVKKIESSSVPMDLLDLPILEMIDQKLAKK